jgi:multiple sugar transport system substrate-binding protein
MLIRKLAFFLLMTTVIIFTGSCSNHATNLANSAADTAKSEEIVLTFTETPLAPNVKNAVYDYNNNHKDIYIKSTEFKADENSVNRLITSLSVGEGSDIIIVNPTVFPAISKVAASGIFYDLNELISKDKELNLSDYNRKVLDYGVIDGKRYFIPIDYDFLGFYAKKGALEENGFITEGPQWNLKNFVDNACNYAQINKEKGKYFVGTKGLSCSDFVKCSGIQIIDTKRRENRITSPEFIEVLNMYKKFTGAICQLGPSDVSANIETVSGYSSIRRYGISRFDSGDFLVLDNKSLWGGWINCDYNIDMELYLYPTYSGENSILLNPELSYGINANCKYKKEAFDFIKGLISEKYQGCTNKEGETHSSFPKHSSYIPINNNAFMLDATFNFGNIKIDGNLSDAERMQRNKTLFSDIKKFSKPDDERMKWNKALLNSIEKLGTCDMVDPVVYEVIDEETKPFLEGKKTAEQVAGVIDDKVKIYLNE